MTENVRVWIHAPFMSTRQPLHEPPAEVLEVVAFRCKPGHAAEIPALCAKALAEAASHGGVLGDTLLRSADDENLFVHQVRWRSLEDARRVAALFPTFACAAAFQELTTDHVLMTHAVRVAT